MKEQYSKYIFNLLKNSNNFKRDNDHKSFVMAIDGAWGTGKTTFIKECLLDNEDFIIIYYDAWKNDFWNNAFEPFLSKFMKSSLFESKEVKEKILSKFCSVASVVAKHLALGFIKKHFEVDLKDVANDAEEKFGENSKEAIYSVYSDFDDFDNIIETFKGYLSEIYKVENKQIVVIIDELDRCKPDFATATLEFVKHIFDCEGYSFIISSNIDELSKSMKYVYGDMDTRAYLNRFFDQISMFPMLLTDGLIKEELKRISFLNDTTIKTITKFFDEHHITNIRDFQRFRAAVLVLSDELKKLKYPGGQETFIFLLLMKTFSQEIYFDLINGKADVKKLPIIIKNTYDNSLFYDINAKKNLYEYICNNCGFRKPFQNINYNYENNSLVGYKEGGSLAVNMQDVLEKMYFLDEYDLINVEKLRNVSLDAYFRRKLEMADFALADFNYKKRICASSLEPIDDYNDEEVMHKVYKCPCGKGNVERYVWRVPGNRSRDLYCTCKDCNEKYYFY